MKTRTFLLLLTVLILIFSGCTPSPAPISESVLPPSGSEAEQPPLTTGTEENATNIDEFEAFIDTWKLSGLVPKGTTMTDENRDGVMTYLQHFDGVIQDYIILLLQKISAGEMTPATQYCDYEGGVYLNFCAFCLYDMNLDGFPEFILNTGGSEADFWYTVYTIIDGELIECGGISGGHAALYVDGSGGLVRYTGHMGVYDITISTLDGATLKTQEIANGVLDYSKDERYPELEEYGYGDYEQYLEFSGIPTLFFAAKG